MRKKLPVGKSPLITGSCYHNCAKGFCSVQRCCKFPVPSGFIIQNSKAKIDEACAASNGLGNCGGQFAYTDRGSVPVFEKWNMQQRAIRT